MDRRSLIFLGALTLAGCATTRRVAPVSQLSTSDIIFQALEPLLAASSSPEGLSIRMASGGCAPTAGIAFYVEMRNGAAYVAFARRTVRDCVGGAEATDVVFTLEELGLRPATPIFLLNPVTASRAKTAPPSSPAHAPGDGSRY